MVREWGATSTANDDGQARCTTLYSGQNVLADQQAHADLLKHVLIIQTARSQNLCASLPGAHLASTDDEDRAALVTKALLQKRLGTEGGLLELPCGRGRERWRYIHNSVEDAQPSVSGNWSRDTANHSRAAAAQVSMIFLG